MVSIKIIQYCSHENNNKINKTFLSYQLILDTFAAGRLQYIGSNIPHMEWIK